MPILSRDPGRGSAAFRCRAQSISGTWAATPRVVAGACAVTAKVAAQEEVVGCGRVSVCCERCLPGREVLTKEKENDSLRCYKIPAAYKKKIRDELLALGVDDFSIYNDMEALARRLKRVYKIGP